MADFESRPEAPVARIRPPEGHFEPPIARIDPPIERLEPPIARIDPPVAPISPPKVVLEPPELEDAVEEYADGLSDTLDDYMERQDLGDEALESREYKKLMELVASLEQTLQQYIAADQQDSQYYFRALIACLDPRHGFGGERQRSDEQGNEIVEGALEAIRQARETIEQKVIVHMEVPEELDETAQIWKDTAEKYRGVGERLPALRAVVGWSGKAAQEYSLMADVQEKASSELLPLPRVLADAYRVISTLNRAVLIAVHAELDAVAKTIASPPPSLPGRLYPRVSHFKQQMELFNMLRLPQALDIAGDGIGSVGEVIADVRGRFKVLAQDWPSGNGLAGITPGDTTAPRLRQHS